MFGFGKKEKVQPKVLVFNLPEKVVPFAEDWYMDIHLVNNDNADDITSATHVVAVLRHKDLNTCARCSMPIGQARESGFRLYLNEMFSVALGLNKESNEGDKKTEDVDK